MDSLTKSVKDTIEKHGMTPNGATILAAHSAGPDSTFLLHILARLAPVMGFTLESIHFNHKLRTSSAQDARFAMETANNLDIRFTMEEDPAPPETQIQGAARKVRYIFFEKIAAAKGDAVRVATGHTLDDSVETSIMWMLRGTGPAAFGGVPPVRGIFIRPLIELRKRRILEWLETNGISYRKDETNETDKYLRNRIRRSLIPVMESLSPGAVESIARLTRFSREQGIFMDRMAEEALTPLKVKDSPGSITLDPAGVLAHPRQVRALLFKTAASKAGADPSSLLETHIKAVDDLLHSNKLGASLDLSGGLKVVLDHAGLSFNWRKDPPSAMETIPFLCPLNIASGGGRLVVTPDEPGEEVVDLGKIPQTAVFRHRQPGDYLVPPNFPGRKKLKKYLIEKKVPSSSRDITPLLADGNEALWYPGLFLSPSIRAGNDCKNTALIRWER